MLNFSPRETRNIYVAGVTVVVLIVGAVLTSLLASDALVFAREFCRHEPTIAKRTGPVSDVDFLPWRGFNYTPSWALGSRSSQEHGVAALRFSVEGNHGEMAVELLLREQPDGRWVVERWEPIN